MSKNSEKQSDPNFTRFIRITCENLEPMLVFSIKNNKIKSIKIVAINRFLGHSSFNWPIRNQRGLWETLLGKFAEVDGPNK